MIAGLEKEASVPDFWNDSKEAQRKMRILSRLKEEVEQWRSLDDQVSTANDLVSLAIEERDDSLQGVLSDEVLNIKNTLAEMEFTTLLSGKFDRRNAIVAVHAGAGGVESQDWVQMLVRMYLRWSEKRGYKSDVLDVSSGDEAGIKSAVIQVSGDYAYGYMKAERGVHRLVRISPFDADHARHTSFALMEVLPEAEEGVDITIEPQDVKTEVFRAGGAGGQSVQKNSTAVRLTHIPTGITVSCQNERSQYQNKTIAMRILLARLVELDMKHRSEELSKLKGQHVSPQWGNQIRSYVLHPYKMVKDHRTGFETSSAEAVLDGEIDDFVKAYLTSNVGGSEEN